jgi:sphingomyelin phosphodiesterase acid-like 3
MINFKKLLTSLAISTFALSCLIFNSQCYAQKRQCLIVSDIHLNPFYVYDSKTRSLKISGKLLNSLGKAPVDQWDKILAKYATRDDIKSTLSGYDSNWALLRSALANMHRQLPKPQFIVIAGDFIWHGQVQKLDMKGYDKTVLADTLKAKTIHYIAKMFRDTFPGIPIIPTLGNNDSDAGDYRMPTQSFLASFAKSWKHNNNQMEKSKTFASAGYYTYTLNSKLKFVVLSTTLYSSDKNAQKNLPNANNMRTWIDTSLSNSNSGVWIVSHIPPGDQMQKNFSNSLLGAVVKNTAKLTYYIAGHTHFNDFRAISDTTKNNAFAFIRVVPSIGTNHGNNPSFEIADIDANYRIKKETTYYLNLQHLPHHIKPDSICWNPGCSINTVIPSPVTAAAILAFVKANKNNPPASYANFHNIGAALPNEDLKKELKKDILQYKP